MAVKKFLRMAVLGLVLKLCYGVSLTIELPGNVRAPPTVSVIEGGNLSLACTSDTTYGSIRWTKLGNADLQREGPDLSIKSVRIEHGGEWTCTAYDDTGYKMKQINVEVNVLYGPGHVQITGPSSALSGELVNVTCSADSNPSPSYFWSYSGNKPDAVIHRGPTFTETRFPEGFKFYCFAETTLIPTLGEAMTSLSYGWKKITEHDVPRIRELPGSVVVKEGGTLDVECVFWASPAPTIYWLVYGTNTTVQLGARFLITNRELDGAYTCVVENTVTNVEGHSWWAQDRKTMLIRVQPADTSTSGGFCPAGCNASSDGSAAYNTTASPACGHGIIAALVIGWVVALILLLIGLFYCIRIHDVRKSPSWSKHHQALGQTADTLDITSTTNTGTSRPEPPHRPVEREPSNTYMTLNYSLQCSEACLATTDRGNPDGGGVEAGAGRSLPNDGYITPKSGLGSSGSYVEPYSTSIDPPSDVKHGQQATAGPHPSETLCGPHEGLAHDAYETV